MSGTPVLVQHIQEIEKVYRGLDGMSLIDLEVLVQAQIESTVEAIYATVTLGNLPIVFTDISFTLFSASGLSKIAWIPHEDIEAYYYRSGHRYKPSRWMIRNHRSYYH